MYKMSEYTDDIYIWMCANKLMMNNNKTEVIVCGTSAKLKSVHTNSVKIVYDATDFFRKKMFVCI